MGRMRRCLWMLNERFGLCPLPPPCSWVANGRSDAFFSSAGVSWLARVPRRRGLELKSSSLVDGIGRSTEFFELDFVLDTPLDGMMTDFDFFHLLL